MHSALNLLLFQRARAALRLQFRKLKTIRGWAYLLLSLSILFVLLNNSTLKQHEAVDSTWQMINSVDLTGKENLLTSFFVIMCLITLVATSGPAVYFSPSETSQLFCGPFTNRDLLIYKFVSYVSGLAVSSLLVAVFARNQFLFASAFWGMFNAMIFIQLVVTSVSLFDQQIRLRGIRFIRVLAIFVFGSISVVAVWGFLTGTGGEKSVLFFALTFPFQLVERTVMASTYWPELVVWGSASAGINAILLGFLIWKNIDFRESVTSSSHQLHQRWQRANRTGVWSDRYISTWRLPIFFGRNIIGITAWRQMTNAYRTFRGSLLKLVMMAACLGPLLSLLPGKMVLLAFGVSVSLSLFLLPKIITFDFRSDWDFITNLRSLPVPAWKITLGQLVTPVVFTTFIELIGILCALPFVSGTVAALLLWLGGMLIPLNTLIYASDNFIFLMFPAPLTPIGRMDFEFFGRSLVEFFVRTLVVSGVLFIGLLVGGLIGSLIRNQGMGVLIGFWLTSVTAIGMILPVMAWAFRRFDHGRP